jgi:hypothetical protein
MFRNKNGILSNIVAIPMPKLSDVNSRSNMIKVLKNKDKIHDVIE